MALGLPAPEATTEVVMWKSDEAEGCVVEECGLEARAVPEFINDFNSYIKFNAVQVPFSLLLVRIGHLETR